MNQSLNNEESSHNLEVENNYLNYISEQNLTTDEKPVEPIPYPLKFLSFKECTQTENAQITEEKFDEYNNSYHDSDIISNDNINGEIREDSGLKLLVINQIETYQSIKPNYYNQPKPKRNLTSPEEPCFNDGKDNKENNLIVFENDIIKGPNNSYKIIDILGQGISGQVFKAESLTDGKLYALKIIKNRRAYLNQSLIEVKILTILNNDIEKNTHIIKLQDYFYYYQHLCIVFELLTEDLFQFLEHKLRGISLRTIRIITEQILEATQEFHKAKIIHCDLKPENILLKIEKDDSNLNGSIHIIVTDFGSSRLKGQTLFKYIQSRYYRAPEVIIGIPYNEKIDIWSIGCICAELYLGVPLLQGSCEYEQLKKIIELFNDIPFSMLQNARNFNKYYKIDKFTNKPILKSHDEYYSENPNDTYQKFTIPYDMVSLDDLLNIKRENNVKKSDSKNHSSFSFNNSTINNQELVAFVDFLKGMLQLDPNLRWNATQCLRHPFITKELLDNFISFAPEDVSQFTYHSFLSNNESLGNSFNQRKYNPYHSMMMSNSFYQYNNNNNFMNNSIDVKNSSFGNYYFNNGINNSFNNSFNSKVYQPNMNNIQFNYLRNFPFAVVDQFETQNYNRKNTKNKMNNTFMTTSFDKINTSADYTYYLKEKMKNKNKTYKNNNYNNYNKNNNNNNYNNNFNNNYNNNNNNNNLPNKKKSFFGQRRNSVKNKIKQNKNSFLATDILDNDEYSNLRRDRNNKSMVVNSQHRTRSQSDANGNMFNFNAPINQENQLNLTFNNPDDSKEINEK